MSNTIKQESLGVATIVLDLTKQGIAVYLPINGHETPDIIGVRDGISLRIEVKALTTFKDASIKVRTHQAAKVDVLAQLEISTGVVRYNPDLETAFAAVKTETLTQKEKDVIKAIRQF